MSSTELSAGLCCHVATEECTDTWKQWWHSVLFLVAVMRTSDLKFFMFITTGSSIENETQKHGNLNGLTFPLVTYIYNMNCCLSERCCKWPSTLKTCL